MDSKDDKKEHQLHIFFVPFLAQSHVIPFRGIAKLLTSEHGVRASIVTTPGNAAVFKDTSDGPTALSIELLLIPFPDVDLPPGRENSGTMPDATGDYNFFKLCQASRLLQEPFEDLLRRHNPDFIVGDPLNLGWLAPVAQSFGIPCIPFATSSLFAECVITAIHSQAAHRDVDELTGTIRPVDGLPHRLVLRRTELPPVLDYMSKISDDYQEEIMSKTLGAIYNTYQELAPEYQEHVQKGGGRVWCVGPVHLSGTDAGPENWGRIKNWLDSKEDESVLYVNFGSEWKFGHEQLREIAIGLDSSGRSFVWVVKGEADGTAYDKWMPEGFEERIRGRGLVITEWVPQFLILNHPALGGSVLHCGWNSTIETVCAGLPVIAWPLHSEQFLNERFVVEVIKTGIRLLEEEMRTIPHECKRVVSGEKVKEAVVKLFGGGEDVKEMRKKAKEYSKLAKMATEKGGSSSVQLSNLFQELTVIAQQKRNKATPPPNSK